MVVIAKFFCCLYATDWIHVLLSAPRRRRFSLLDLRASRADHPIQIIRENSMTKHEVDPTISEFQRRRKSMMYGFGTCASLIAFSLLLMQIVDFYPDLFGLGKRTWTSIAVAQLSAGAIFAIRGFMQYRCPVCREIPRGHDRFYLGVIVDPERCPHCHARLRL